MKKLYYKLEDSVGSTDVTLSLAECMEYIKEDMAITTEKDKLEEGFRYTLTPVFLSEEEYKNLKKYEK